MSTAATMTKSTETKQPEAAPSVRALPVIEPAACVRNYDGFAFSEFMVRLPEDAVFGDLNEPRIWRKVQGSQVSLKRFDRLIIVAFDENWIATAIVSGATRDGVTLTKPVKTDFDSRGVALFETPEYRIHWTGVGYSVLRKADNFEVAAPVASPVQAQKNLWHMYPQKVPT